MIPLGSEITQEWLKIKKVAGNDNYLATGHSTVAAGYLFIVTEMISPLPEMTPEARNDPMATGTDLTAALACVTAVVNDSGSYRTRSQWSKTNTSNKFFNFPFKKSRFRYDTRAHTLRILAKFVEKVVKVLNGLM